MSGNNGFTTFLFDLDGTLIDSVELILSSYRHTMRVHRGTMPTDDVWLAGLGTPLWVQFRHFTNDPAEIDAMVATYREHNHAHHDRMVRPYDGVAEAVAALARRGPLGVVTSKLHASAERGLRLCGLERHFRVIVGADDVEHPKPDPEPVERALASLDADPARTVFVGDSPHDMAAGRAAGVATAAVLWGPFPREHLAPEHPTHWLGAPAELLAL